jgi:hypothetical protein
MVIADDASNNFDDFTLITVSTEYNIIPSRIHQDILLKSPKAGMIIGYQFTNMYPDSCSME